MWSSGLRGSQACQSLIVVERPLALYAQQTPASIRQVYTVCQCIRGERPGSILCTNTGSTPLLLDQCGCGTPKTGLGGGEQQAAAVAENNDWWVVDRGGNERSSGKRGAVDADYKRNLSKLACWVAVSQIAFWQWIDNQWTVCSITKRLWIQGDKGSWGSFSYLQQAPFFLS